MDNEFQSSRSEKRAKRRKTNLVLNGLIGLVLLLIIVVSANIFLGDNKENTGQKDNKIEHKETSNNNQKEETSPADEGTSTEESTESEETTSDISTDTMEDENSESDSNVIETEGGSDNSVQKTIVNPSWKPVGTSQTGEHTTVYDQNSADWKEMLKAAATGLSIDESNMTTWFLGNNGNNKSVGTFSTKDQPQKYKVYLEWVENEGWKPTKVEVLK